MTMETRSHWKDSGYDCDLCGGQIFKRTDEEPLGISAYYQCRRCGAQWSLGQKLLREGDSSKQRKQRPSGQQASFPSSWPNWVWLLIGFVVMFLLFRAGSLGAILLRFSVPVVFVLIVGLVVFRLGRELEWW